MEILKCISRVQLRRAIAIRLVELVSTLILVMIVPLVVLAGILCQIKGRHSLDSV